MQKPDRQEGLRLYTPCLWLEPSLTVGLLPEEPFLMVGLPHHWEKRPWYSPETRNALTISALTKLPLKAFSLSSQNFQPL